MDENLKAQVIDIVRQKIQALPPPEETNYWHDWLSDIEHVLVDTIIDELYEITGGGKVSNPDTIKPETITKEDFSKLTKPLVTISLLVFKNFIREASGDTGENEREEETFYD